MLEVLEIVDSASKDNNTIKHPNKNVIAYLQSYRIEQIRLRILVYNVFKIDIFMQDFEHESRGEDDGVCLVLLNIEKRAF